MPTIPKEFKEPLDNAVNTTDMIEKILFITVGDKVKTYKDLNTISETKRWFFYSQLDKFLSKLSDKQFSNEVTKLKTKYSFPEQQLMFFPRYNRNVTLGYKTNTFGLDFKKLSPTVQGIINENLEQRQKFLDMLTTKNIKYTKGPTNISEALNVLNNRLNNKQKANVEKLVSEKGGVDNISNINPKDILTELLK